MAKRGKCVNIDCDHYKEEFDIQAGEEFECPYCHQPLGEVEGKKKNNGGDPPKPIGKLIGIIAAAVIVLGGLGYGGYALYDSHQKSEQEKAELQAKAEQQAEEQPKRPRKLQRKQQRQQRKKLRTQQPRPRRRHARPPS